MVPNSEGMGVGVGPNGSFNTVLRCLDASEAGRTNVASEFWCQMGTLAWIDSTIRTWSSLVLITKRYVG